MEDSSGILMLISATTMWFLSLKGACKAQTLDAASFLKKDSTLLHSQTFVLSDIPNLWVLFRAILTLGLKPEAINLR